MPVKNLSKIDLEKELLLRIGGENDDHVVSWDILKNVGDKLEALILSLARFTSDDPISIQNFTLDFTGFYNGSAVPAFRFNSRPVPTLFNELKTKESVEIDFSIIMRSVSEGNYQSIVDKYENVPAKNDIIRKVYDFTNSAGDVPVSIVRRTKDNKFKNIYSIRRLTKERFDKLITTENNILEFERIETPGVARILTRKSKTGRTTTKTQEIYNDKEAILSLKLNEISVAQKKYIFKTPVLFQIYQEGKGTIIENESLQIFAAGKTKLQAKDDLYIQFDENYKCLSELPNEQLGKKLLEAKQYYGFIIKTILNT